MNSSFSKILIFILIIPFLCSAGYVGTLPDLKKNIKINPDKDITEEIDAKDILPLDINELPPNYTKSILKNSRYSQYLSDADEIMQLMENLKETIKTRKSIQDFNAISGIINIYIKNLERKYKNSNERYFESYKQLVNLNNNIQMMSEYWADSNRNVKYVSNYKTAGFYSSASVNEKLERLLNIIDDTLIVLKESAI